MQPAPKTPLPFMKTMDDARAICQRENDPFYTTAFLIETWLGDVTLQTVAQYAERKSAKNRKLQQGLAAKSFEATFGHASNAAALDECIIKLWPLVRRHHWTYRDLMNVIQSVAPVPLRYPCEREQDLATYCNNVLGLRKSSKKGKSDPHGRPPGYEVARAMCDRTVS